MGVRRIRCPTCRNRFHANVQSRHLAPRRPAWAPTLLRPPTRFLCPRCDRAITGFIAVLQLVSME